MKTFLILSLTAVLGFSSCVTLQHVNAYADASLSGVRHFPDINTGFEQNCREKCQFKSALKGEIDNRLVCDCDKPAQADSVNRAIVTVLTAYFSGLSKLSDNKPTDYHVKDLAENVRKMKWLDDRQTNAYSDIASVLLDAATTGYRRNKLQTYISRADTSIVILAKKLQTNLKVLLVKELDNKITRLTAYYQEFEEDKTLSTYQKGKIAEDYYIKLNEIEEKKNEIDRYTASLDAIIAGHHKLFDNRMQLNTRETKDRLVQYASNIAGIYRDFNALRNP